MDLKSIYGLESKKLKSFCNAKNAFEKNYNYEIEEITPKIFDELRAFQSSAEENLQNRVEVGTDGPAAMALVYPVTIVSTALGTLFETGGSAVVSEKFGANKKILAEKIISQILGTMISVWCFKYSEQKFSTSLSFESLKYILQEFKIGAGFALGSLMMFFIEYFLNATLLNYDVAHLLAVAAIANIIFTFFYLPLNGLDTGIQPLMSKLFAAHKEQEYLRVMRYGFYLTMKCR